MPWNISKSNATWGTLDTYMSNLIRQKQSMWKIFGILQKNPRNPQLQWGTKTIDSVKTRSSRSHYTNYRCFSTSWNQHWPSSIKHQQQDLWQLQPCPMNKRSVPCIYIPCWKCHTGIIGQYVPQGSPLQPDHAQTLTMRRQNTFTTAPQGTE